MSFMLFVCFRSKGYASLHRLLNVLRPFGAGLTLPLRGMAWNGRLSGNKNKDIFPPKQ